MIQDNNGDLLASTAHALVNPVNCEGVMGKGLALEFKTRYPEAFEDYRKMCQRKELTPGKLHTYQLPDGRWIINFPTKTYWRQPSKMDYIDAGLPVLAEFIQWNAIPSIAIPALGCGLGGLSWHLVRQRIENSLANLAGVDVWLFPPKASASPSFRRTAR
jgi:O-acetyl-ADP-ribose deacetylase (regulator of RNase III)